MAVKIGMLIDGVYSCVVMDHTGVTAATEPQNLHWQNMWSLRK